MRNKTIQPATFAGIIFLSAFIILFPFFSGKAQKTKRETAREQRVSDTPRNKTIIISRGELDKAMAEIDNVNPDSIYRIVQAALASVNFDSIGSTVQAALASVNTDNISRQVELSIKNVDMQKMQADIDKAMTELKNSNWQKEFQKGMAEMQKGLQEMKKVSFADIQKQMDAAKKEMASVDIKGEMTRAKTELAKAKTELLLLKTQLANMQKDGLIKEGEKVKLEWKNGRLYINGKEQSAEISEKYKDLENIRFNQKSDDDENVDSEDF